MLADGARNGDYGAKARGRFGPLAACKDLAAIVSPAASAAP
jgi:hypothetical protein